MRHLNQKATKQFQKLLAQLPAPEQGHYHSHVQLNNAKGSFMPVSIEVVEQIQDENWKRVISVAHYGEQNGDSMADPEITFAECLDATGKLQYYPLSYRNDYMGMDREYVQRNEKGVPTKFHKGLQSDTASFSNDWMANIILQQGL
jgi:hypothetical protein